MAAAVGWAALAASTLLIAYHLSPGRRVIAVVMALGVGLLLGSVLDGIPEFSSSGLRLARWPERRVLHMWTTVVAVSALSAGLGYALLDPAHGLTGDLVQAFAAGALLAMLATTMLPEAYDVEGLLTGPLVVTGFALALVLSGA